MWRLLEVGERIQDGDEYYEREKWIKWNACVGLVTNTYDPPTRRRIPDAPKTCADIGATEPDPGEGFRLLSVGERIRENDEIYVGEWQIVVKPLVGSVLRDWDKSLVRRKVVEPVPAPVVKTGDLVGIDSGTWQGCTGRVIGFQTRVRTTGFNPCMVAEESSKPSIRLDNVLVGGLPLTVCEPLDNVTVLEEPVVDPEWRLLEIGETIRVEDEYLLGCGWLAGSSDTRSVGQKLETYHVKHRRRVRIESPGWRYLDAGEVVRDGDESLYSGSRWPWRSCGHWHGKTLKDGFDQFFRRKTVPFAG